MLPSFRAFCKVREEKKLSTEKNSGRSVWIDPAGNHYCREVSNCPLN